MASLTLRLVKGSPLTNAEFDANFSSLNTDVLSRLLASSNLADLTNAGTARTNLGLGSVENKSSATIRGEISSLNVTTALGFTPQVALTSGASIKTVNGQSVLGSGNIQIDGGVTSFNTRTGAVTLDLGDVTAAIGFTPANKAGDTFTGAVLTSNAGGFTANSAAKLWTDSNRGRLDLYEGAAQTKSLRVFNANGYGVMGMTSAENLELWTNGVARLTLGGSSGITASTDITVANGVDSRINLQVSGVTESILSANATRVVLGSSNAIPLVLNTNGVTRLTLTGGGYITTGASEYVGIGAQAGTNQALRVARNLENGTSAFGVTSDGTFQAGVTSTGAQYRSVARTAASAFTMASLHHFQATQATLGAGSAITTQSGFVADSTLIGATNNYGFYGNIPSGAGRYNLYMPGTAANYLAGALQVDGAITQGANQLLHAGNYSSYALPLSGGTLTGVTKVKAGHDSTRFQLHYNHDNADTTSGSAGYLTLWASEPGISYPYTGIGGNINLGGQHYGRATSGQPYGVYLRFQTTAGNSEFWSTSGNVGVAGGEGSRVAYVDSSGDLWATTGAHKVLHAGNYSSYALPLSGGTLTGSVTFTNLYPSGNTAYGLQGNSGYFDTVNSGADSDPLELVYVRGASVKIGTGTYGSKPLYAVGIYDNGNQVLHAGNYTSYALPLSGGTLTGSIGFSTAYNYLNGLKFFTGNTGYNYLFTGTNGMVWRNQADSIQLASLSDTGILNVASNIYINGQQALHAGNFTGWAQPLLVSGSSIKTVNGTSLLGAGNIAISTTDSTKLPLTGGQINGTLVVGSTGLMGTLLTVGAPGGNQLLFGGGSISTPSITASSGATLTIGPFATRLSMPSTGDPTIGSNVILHAGNYTSYVTSAQYLGTAATKAIAFNAQTISENITIGATQNGLSAGPITISSGFTVTITSGGNWAIV